MVESKAEHTMLDGVVRQGALDGLATALRPARDADAARVMLSECRVASLHVLRGAEDGALAAAVTHSTGLTLPRAPRRSACAARVAVLWLGPDEWLLRTDGDTDIAPVLDAAAAQVDVSDAYTVMRIAGRHASDVLAKSVSIDLHPRVLPPGAVVRTGFARAQAIVQRLDDDCFDLYVGRSFARYAWRWLEDASAEFGLRIRA